MQCPPTVAAVLIVWIVRRGVIAFVTAQRQGRVEISAPAIRGSVGWKNGDHPWVEWLTQAPLAWRTNRSDV